jgi:hypothetical protein
MMHTQLYMPRKSRKVLTHLNWDIASLQYRTNRSIELVYMLLCQLRNPVAPVLILVSIPCLWSFYYGVGLYVALPAMVKILLGRRYGVGAGTQRTP